MSIHTVLEQLREITRGLPEHDGVRCFNELYLRVTERVGLCLERGGFEDPLFMERLDQRFADLYLDALERRASLAWAPLIDARADRSIAPERFMLAGVNAHINYDLPLALVDTCREVGGRLEDESPRHRDFCRVDDILAEVEEQMRGRLDTARVKSVIALWEVVRAREHAWDAALSLAVGLQGETRQEFEAELDRRAGEWSELLLHL